MRYVCSKISRIGRQLAGLLLVATALVAPAQADAVTLHDPSGHPIEVGDASRIISIGGAITEILYALGADKQVVAVDTTSFYPPEALKTKPNVGYMRQLSPEGVLSLTPSLIIANEGAGPAQTLSILEAARVPFVLVPDHFTGDGIIQKIEIVAAAIGREAQGRCLVASVKADLAALADVRDRVKNPLRVLFLLSFSNNRPMAAGRKTAAEGVIRMAGAINAIDEFDGYKLLSDEAVIAARPDVVLMMQRNSHPIDGKAVLDHPAFATTPAARNGRFVNLEALYLLDFGLRTAQAARNLAGTFYPDLAGQPFAEHKPPDCK